MKKTIRDLLALQTVDLRIRELENKGRRIPAERAELTAEFEVVRTALGKAQAAVKAVEQKIRTTEGEIAACQARLQEIKVHSASVKKVSDYNAVMAEIAATEKSISDLETSELAMMDEQESAKAAVARAEKNYRATGRTVQKEVRELDALKESILREITEKTVESRELEKFVAAATLPVYKRMLSSGKGIPVGFIHDGLCSNCSLTQSPMTRNEAKKGNLVTCDNCSCLLYDPNPID